MPDNQVSHGSPARQSSPRPYDLTRVPGIEPRDLVCAFAGALLVIGGVWAFDWALALIAGGAPW